MKKKLFLLIIFLFVFIPSIIKADYSAIITGDTVRIRSGASTSKSILFTVNSGTSITVLDKTLVSGSGCSNGWVKVSYKEKTGYVCSSYVKYVSSAFDGINTTDWTARVSGNDVSVREKASSSSKQLASLSLGCNVTIIDEVSKSDANCSSGVWYKIKYYGNKTGYMCKNYVTKKEDTIANDEEYAKELKESGFPDSYIPFLTKLHQKHPEWKFIAKNTGYTFSKAVNAEEGKCYMQTTNNNYRTSTKPAEGSSWFKVNSAVIAFYMDPRNWLTDNRIFMFEKLDYSNELESVYPTLVKNIFSGGKLGDDKYIVPMVAASKSNKISPLAVASRIRLEVGANGSDSTSGEAFTFKGVTYKGYYNFFNIGAYEDTIQGVKVNSVLRGLLYAAKVINRDGKPWNDIEVAIKEGSSFLANGYINNGQGTVYYQKFNVSPDADYSNFTHQYMTNIQAPATEGASSYSSYKKGSMLNTEFMFEIPVYKSMPDYTSLPENGDNNNYLKSLSVTGYNISPTFDKDVLNYEVNISKSVNKVTINAVSESANATISGIGEITLEEDTTDITITVTSELNTVKKYVLTINRVDDKTETNDVISKTGYTLKDNYITNIKYNTNMDLVRNNLMNNGASNVVITDTNNKTVTKYTDYIGTGYKVTVSTKLETKTYTIIIKGDTSGDGKVDIMDLLEVQQHIKKVKNATLTNERLNAGDIDSNGVVDIFDLLLVQRHIKKVELI